MQVLAQIELRSSIHCKKLLQNKTWANFFIHISWSCVRRKWLTCPHFWVSGPHIIRNTLYFILV